jgi:hypothetical protein
MQRKLTWVLLFTAAVAFTALYHVRKVMATPAHAFAGTTLALGRFGPIDVFNHAVLPTSTSSSNNDDENEHKQKIWLSSQKTKGLSDVYVQNNVWQPGGSTGWHSHPGHSLIIVTAGTVTDYESDDPKCKPQVYTQGMGFVDAGGDHVHLIRNEGTVPASTVAVQVIPAGATRRIDAATAPANCPGIE